MELELVGTDVIRGVAWRGVAWTAVAPCKTRGVTVELNHEIRLPASVVLAFTRSREPVAQKKEPVLPRGLV